MTKREYIREEFEPIYASKKDARAIGGIEDGNELYILDDTPDEDPYAESYGAPDEIKVYMKGIHVRLHETSRLPFIDVNPKLGMELSFLRPEHKVFIHASHRSFDFVRDLNARSRIPNPSDEFTEAFIKMGQARVHRVKEDALPYIKRMAVDFRLILSDREARRITFGRYSSSYAEVLRFANEFKCLLDSGF